MLFIIRNGLIFYPYEALQRVYIADNLVPWNLGLGEPGTSAFCYSDPMFPELNSILVSNQGTRDSTKIWVILLLKDSALLVNLLANKIPQTVANSHIVFVSKNIFQKGGRNLKIDLNTLP